MARFPSDTRLSDEITEITVWEWLEKQNLGMLLTVVEKTTAAIRKREHARADAVRATVEAELGPTTELPQPPIEPGVPTKRVPKRRR